MTHALDTLREASYTLATRGKQRDQPEGERSMKRVVDAFNAATGNSLTEREGWMFMVQLKAVRAMTGPHINDDCVDGAAYFALLGETTC